MKGISAAVFLGIFITCIRGGYANGQYIVKFKDGGGRRSAPLGSEVTIEEKISQTSNIYTASYPLVIRNQAREDILEEIQQNPEVEYAQLDHPLTLRSLIPNDPNFGQLWSFQNLSIVNSGTANTGLAWEHYGVGGKDPSGNDIVVVVVDGGFYMKHRDLIGNWFVNTGEIPNNSIDDDQNGYIDDYSGYSVAKGNGLYIPSGSHGTHVAGVIGAVGNNGVGVVGVNWNVKIIPIHLTTMFSLKTSDVIKAYSYALEMKTLWLRTNGQKGANIVATNSSFGINFADCKSGEYPIWDDMYEKMGAVGILSAVAAPNISINIDQVGDVPTGCTSEFIVSVTNMTKEGRKNNNAGYGKTTIDIAAPGTNIFSTVSYNRYRMMTGTSMAAPHITGAIAYLHSILGPGVQTALDYYMPSTTLNIKRALMDSVRPSASLSQTVSGGTLDLHKAATLLTGSYEKYYLDYFKEQ